ncbi:hypothetical protein [Companilactobacillus farciminis]|nr:hypothetical protein [Companilactobacillus farciminis]
MNKRQKKKQRKKAILELQNKVDALTKDMNEFNSKLSEFKWGDDD